MVEYNAQINQENEKENKINFYRLDNILGYLINVIDSFIILSNYRILRRAKLISFQDLIFHDELLCYGNCFTEISTFFKKENKNKNSNGIIEENQIKKRKNNIKDNKIINRNFIIINLIQFIIVGIFYQIKCNILFNLFHFQVSKITLKIKGIGTHFIFGNDNNYKFTGINYLNEVTINGNKQDTITYNYYFNQTDNFVELIWDKNINNCSCMFFRCSNINEINLSNFETSQVTDMHYMFHHCSSLTLLDLSNLNTSQVKDMKSMFIECSSLISLDLSNFDTSQVTDMQNMFNGCSSLTSLNLSNFNTSKVSLIQSMFNGCINLEYINMKNFDESKLGNYIESHQYMFKNVPGNIVICINESITKLKIFPQIKI